MEALSEEVMAERERCAQVVRDHRDAAYGRGDMGLASVLEIVVDEIAGSVPTVPAGQVYRPPPPPPPVTDDDEADFKAISEQIATRPVSPAYARD